MCLNIDACVRFDIALMWEVYNGLTNNVCLYVCVRVDIAPKWKVCNVLNIDMYMCVCMC